MGQKSGESDLSFSMGFTVKYINPDGSHSLAELQDGARDGRNFYRKSIPRIARFMVPEMSHILVSYDKDDTVPAISAFAGDQAISGLDVDKFLDDSHIISLEQLEELRADQLVIKGGSYSLHPTPKPETLKKYVSE